MTSKDICQQQIEFSFITLQETHFRFPVLVSTLWVNSRVELRDSQVLNTRLTFEIEFYNKVNFKINALIQFSNSFVRHHCSS